MKINGSLVFDASSASEIQNLRIQKVTSLPTYSAGADNGRVIYLTSTNALYYGSDGAGNWVAVATGGNAASLQVEVDALETSIGAAVNTSGVFQASAFSGFTKVTSPTSITNVLSQLDAAISGKDALAELFDVAISAPADNQLLQYNSTLSKWENTTIGSGSGVQAWDAGLDNLAALAGTGIVVETADGVFANRSLVQPGAGITITNADGVSGNPTFALANDLAALEGLTTTGYVVRTGDGTATTRSIAGTAGNVVVTNGSGVTSDTSINLATVTQAGTGDFVKVTLDTFGRVTGNTPVVAADITALVNATYVNVAGDTMSTNASLVFSGTGTVTGLPAPVADTDAANKAYVDAITAGLSWKQAVRVATTGNITIATALNSGDVIDGVTLADGDRVLVKDQSAPAENGIYVVGASPARAADMNAAAEFDGAAVFVQEGTANQGSGWTETATVATVGTDPVVFSQFTGGALYTWGVGLSNSGNTINVNLGAGIAQLPSDEVGIDLFDTSTGAIILTDDGTSRAVAPATNSKLHLLLDPASTGGLDQGAAGLFIKAAGVTNAMLANPSVTLNADVGTNTTLALGQTLEIAGSSTQGIETTVAGQTITVAGINADATQKGVASFDAAHFSVTAGAVSLAASLDDLTNVSTADAAAANSLLQKSGPGAADWVAVSPATVGGTINLGDLADVGSATPTDNGVLVGNGTTWNTQQIYYLHTQGSTDTTWTVTHNLGQRYCNVTIVDASDEVIIPQSITFDSTNQLTVTFNSTVAGKVVVMGVA